METIHDLLLANLLEDVVDVSNTFSLQNQLNLVGRLKFASFRVGWIWPTKVG